MSGRAEREHFRVVFRKNLSFCLLAGLPLQGVQVELGHPKPSGIQINSSAWKLCYTPAFPSAWRVSPGNITWGSLSQLCEHRGCQLAHPEPPCWHLPDPPAQWVPWAGDPRGLVLLESSQESGSHPQGPEAPGPQSRLRLHLVFEQKVWVWCQHFPPPKCLGTACVVERGKSSLPEQQSPEHGHSTAWR